MNDLVALNTGSGTDIRQTGEVSHLHIAMTNINIACTANWSVINDTLGSDHIPIIIKLNEAAITEVAMPQWSYQRVDWDSFKTICHTLLTTDVIGDNVVSSRDRVVAAIIQAAESSIPMVKPALNLLRKSVPFWTKECTEAVRK